MVIFALTAAYIAETPQRPMQDRMHGRHAGNDNKEVGFSRAPINAGSIVVCAA